MNRREPPLRARGCDVRDPQVVLPEVSADEGHGGDKDGVRTQSDQPNRGTLDKAAEVVAEEAQRMAKALAAETIRACALLWPFQSAVIAAVLGADRAFVAETYAAGVHSAPMVAAGVISELGADNIESDFFDRNPFPVFSWPEIANIAGRTDGLPITSDEVH